MEPIGRRRLLTTTMKPKLAMKGSNGATGTGLVERSCLFGGLPQFVWRSVNLIGIIRALSSSGPARPYIARLIVFSRLICPSA